MPVLKGPMLRFRVRQLAALATLRRHLLRAQLAIGAHGRRAQIGHRAKNVSTATIATRHHSCRTCGALSAPRNTQILARKSHPHLPVGSGRKRAHWSITSNTMFALQNEFSWTAEPWRRTLPRRRLSNACGHARRRTRAVATALREAARSTTLHRALACACAALTAPLGAPASHHWWFADGWQEAAAANRASQLLGEPASHWLAESYSHTGRRLMMSSDSWRQAALPRMYGSVRSPVTSGLSTAPKSPPSPGGMASKPSSSSVSSSVRGSCRSGCRRCASCLRRHASSKTDAGYGAAQAWADSGRAAARVPRQQSRRRHRHRSMWGEYKQRHGVRS